METHQTLVGDDKHAVVAVCLDYLRELLDAALALDKLGLLPIKEVDGDSENALVGAAIHFKKH